MSVGADGGNSANGGAPATTETVSIAVRADASPMEGRLWLPAYARGVLIVPAMGVFGSSTAHADQVIASIQRFAEVGTLVVDLLSLEERRDADGRSSLESGPRSAPDAAWVEKLASRLNGVTDWMATHETARHLRMGYLADGVAGAAALVAASGRSEVRAAVLHAARLDLAGQAVEALRTPTLLVVGAMDDDVLAMNRSARARMKGTTELATVPSEGATLTAPGREELAKRASEWFAHHFG